MPRRPVPPDPAERARIVAAAVAIMGELGPTAAKLSVIATRAGVAYGTLYRHFPTRDALLLEGLLDQTRTVEGMWAAAATEADPVERVIAICSAPLENIRNVPGLRAAIAGVEAIAGAEDEVARQYRSGVALLRAAIDEATEADRFQGLQPDALATMLMGMAASYFTLGAQVVQQDADTFRVGLASVIRKLA
jgi:AcrR family transcriptional regulator